MTVSGPLRPKEEFAPQASAPSQKTAQESRVEKAAHEHIPDALHLAATSGKLIPISLSEIKLSNQECDHLEQLVTGSIADLLEEDQISNDIQTLRVQGARTETEKLLHPLEIAVIRFYTRDGFRLLNGTFDFENHIHRFMDYRNLDPNNFNEVTQAGLTLRKILASALNKLPPSHDAQLFRGDTMSQEQFDQMKVGGAILMKNFVSTSKYEGIAASFAEVASENPAKIQTLYVIENPASAKNISELSAEMGINEEQERLYAPNQYFEIVSIEKKQEFSLLQILPEDENNPLADPEIQQAKAQGLLVEMTGKKGNIKYYKREEPFEYARVVLRELKL